MQQIQSLNIIIASSGDLGFSEDVLFSGYGKVWLAE